MNDDPVDLVEEIPQFVRFNRKGRRGYSKDLSPIQREPMDISISEKVKAMSQPRDRGEDLEGTILVVIRDLPDMPIMEPELMDLRDGGVGGK